MNEKELLIAERNTAWAELRNIRAAIDANPEESTLDEVSKIVVKCKALQTELAKEQKRLDWVLNSTAYHGIGVLTYVDDMGEVQNYVVPRGKIRETIDVLMDSSHD